MKERITSFIKRWRTLLISYLLVFLLPFSLASFFVQRSFLGEATSATIHRSATEVSASLNRVDELFREMQVLVGNMKYDTGIASSYSPDHLLQIQNLMSKLKTVHSASDHYDRIWYYCQGDALLCSDTTTHSTSFFFDHRYRLDSEITDWEKIVELEVCTAVDQMTDERVLMFISPFSKLTNDNNKLQVNRHYMVFCIRQEWFEQLAQPFVKQSGKMELVLNNQVVLQFSNEANAEQLKEIQLSSYKGDYLFSSDQIEVYNGESFHSGNWYSTFYGVSAFSRSRLNVAVKDDYINGTRRQLIWNVALAGLLSLGFVTTLLATKLINQPMKKLKQQMMEANHEIYHANYMEDDYEIVESFITSMRNENIWLKMNMETHRTAALNFLIFSLFRGKIENMKAFNQFGQRFNLCMEYPCFDVLTILLAEEGEEEIKIATETTIDIIKSQFGSETQLLVQRQISNREMDVLICYDPKQYAWFHQCLMLAEARLREELTEGYVIGMGTNREDTLSIPLAHMQAMLSCNDRMFEPARSIFEYNVDRLARMSDSTLDGLENALRSHNYVYTAQAIEQICVQIEKYDLSASRQLTLETLYLLAEWMEDSHCYEPLCPSISELYLPNYDAAEALSQLLHGIAEEFYHRAELAGNRMDLAPANNYSLYVQQKFDSPDFSLKNMAADFSLPMSTLSKYFLESTGERLNDYVIRLRMEKAARLLTATDLPVRKVGMSVGYYDVNSFIRRFKAYYHCTPTVYRQNPISEAKET